MPTLLLPAPPDARNPWARGYDCFAKAVGRRGVLRTYLNLHAAEEAKLAKALEAFFGTMSRAVKPEIERALSHLGKAAGKRPVSSLIDHAFDNQSWTDRLKATVRGPLLAAVVAGAKAELLLFKPRRQYEMIWCKERGADDWTRDELEAERIELPPEVSSAIRSHMDGLLKKPYWSYLTDTIKADMTRAMDQAMQDRLPQRDIVKKVMEVMGPAGNKARARNTARTEITGSLGAGGKSTRDALAAAGVVKGAIWNSLHDKATRETHLEADGQEIAIGEKFVVGGWECDFPGDPDLPAEERCQCILPGAVVQGVFEAAMRSRYTGQVVEIVTRSGRRLSLTPNHPVLTEHGFVRAGAVQRGDQVVAYDGEFNASSWPSSGSNEVDHEPAVIEQVFEAFVLRSVVRSGPGGIEVIRANVDDFHGDGQFVEGDVEIVRSDRTLTNHCEAGLLNKRGDAGFALEHPRLVPKSRDGDFRFFGHRLLTPGRSGPGGATLTLHKVPVSLDLTPLEQFRFGPAANLDASLFERSRESASANSRVIGNGLDGHAASVSANQRGQVMDLAASVRPRANEVRPWPRPAALDVDASLAKGHRQDDGRSALLASNLVERHPGAVFLDEVVEVRVNPFSGHVYDLQSPNGFIVASGIFVSNCRCFVTSVTTGDELLSGGEAEEGETPEPEAETPAEPEPPPTEPDDDAEENEQEEPEVEDNTHDSLTEDDWDDLEDALGKITGRLIDRQEAERIASNLSDDEVRRLIEHVENRRSFCPTGSGGGVDPTCSPEQDGQRDRFRAAKHNDCHDPADGRFCSNPGGGPHPESTSKPTKVPGLSFDESRYNPSDPAHQMGERVRLALAKSGGTIKDEAHAREIGGIIHEHLMAQEKPLREQIQATNDRLAELRPKFTLAPSLDERDAVGKQIAATRAEQDRLQTKLSAGTPERYLKAMSAVREMGGTPELAHQPGSEQAAATARAAAAYYPRDVVDRSNRDGAVAVTRSPDKVSSYGQGVMRIGSGLAPDEALAAATHEWGHRVQEIVPAVGIAERQFFDRRTAGLATEPYYQRRDGVEVKGISDHFADRYTGRVYDAPGHYRGNEVFTTGMEGVVFGKGNLMHKDPEHAKLVLGLLAAAR